MKAVFAPRPKAKTALSESATAQASRRARRKKRLRLTALLFLICLAPSIQLQVKIYRQNLRVTQAALGTVPDLSAQDRLLVLAPHCDDETLGAGGTIAQARRRGIPVRLVFLTNGDGSRSTQIAVNIRQRRLNSFQELAQLRQKETLKAAATLGVATKDVVFLGYPDGGIRELWLRHWTKSDLYRSPYTGADHSPYHNARTKNAAYCGEQVLADIGGALSDFRPTVVITTHPADTHPDHAAAYEFMRAALEVKLKQAKAHSSAANSWASNTELWTFLIHHGVWPVPYGYHPQDALMPPMALIRKGTIWNQAALDEPAQLSKKNALECYPSQLAFTPLYLRSFLRRNEIFGTIESQTAPTRYYISDIVPETHTNDIIHDSTNDSLKYRLWPAADLENISVVFKQNIHNDTKNDILNLRVCTFGKLPSPRLNYRVWLHALSTKRSAVYRVDIYSDRGVWRATAHGAQNTTDLSVQARPDGFDLFLQLIPSNPLGIARGDSLLVSAESFISKSRLDSIPTGTLRVPSS